MTHEAIQLTLAADMGGMVETLVTIVIFAVVVIGSIVQSVKESSSKKRSSGEAEPTPAEKQAAQDRLRELAEKRRQQLQELARRRREAQGGAQTETHREPQETFSPVASQRAAEQAAERRRMIEQHQREEAAEAMRQAQLEQARAERAAKAEYERQMKLRQRQESLARRERQQPDRMAVMNEGVGTHEVTHRHVSNADGVPVRRPNRHAEWLSRLPSMKRETLQRAVLLQEVLNKPLSLRDPFDAPIDRQ